MKKGWMGALALVLSAAVICGCGKKENSGSDLGKYVTLPEYKGTEIEVTPLDTILDAMTASVYFERVSDVGEIRDRAVALYDLANIDYEGKKDGVAFAGGTAQGAELLIGSGQFIGGFEEGLIGVMPGETVDLNLRFPDNYGSADLAGQEVVFTVTVNFVSEMREEQVASIGIADVTTLEQLREYLREDAESDYLSAAGDAIMEKLLDGAVYSALPEELVGQNRQLYENYINQMAQYYGMEAQAYLAMFGLDYESAVSEYAQRYTKQQILIHAVADQEELNISDKDLDERLNAYAQELGVTVNDLLVNDLTKDDYRDSFLYEDVMKFLVDHSVNRAAK